MSRKYITTKSTKCCEQYMELLEKYKQMFPKEKVVILMQIGDFYEIYGFEYPNGDKKGELWNICEDLGMISNVSEKNMTVENNKNIKVYMWGFGTCATNKWVNLIVEDYEWVAVVISQEKRKTATGEDEVLRYEDAIVSSGINTFSQSESNIIMSVYIEKTPVYNSDSNSLYAGISFIDNLTGDSGIVQYPQKNGTIGDDMIYDEILKYITAYNPVEVLINTRKLDLSESSIVNRFNLETRKYTITDISDNKHIRKNDYQNSILKNVYKSKSKYINQFNEYPTAKIAHTLLLEYIIRYNYNVVNELSMPKLNYEDSGNLFIANNALVQLNIINNIKINYHTRKMTSLYQILNKCRTPMGKRLFRHRLTSPLTDTSIIESRYDNIERFITLIKSESQQQQSKQLPEEQLLLQEQLSLQLKQKSQSKKKQQTNQEQHINQEQQLNQSNQSKQEHKKNQSKTFNDYVNGAILSKIVDIKSLLRRIARGDAKINDMPILYNSLKIVYRISNWLNSNDHTKFEFNLRKGDNTKIHELIELIDKSFELNNCTSSKYTTLENNIYKYGVLKELDKSQKKMISGKRFLDTLVSKLSIIADPNEYSKKNKPLFNLQNNAKDGYHISSTQKRTDQLKKALKHKNFEGIKLEYDGKTIILTKDDITITNKTKSSYIIESEHIKRIDNSMSENREIIRKLTQTIFPKWCIDMTNTYGKLLNKINDYIAELDYYLCCARVAKDNNYCKPIISADDDSDNNSFIKAEDIRHPIIEYIQKEIKYIPNDINIGGDNPDGILLFGINAVGKSSYMKSIGIAVLMAQSGMYVAAKSFNYCPYTSLFTRIQNNDNIFAGQSTFTVEMSEFKTIMQYSDNKSIVLGDELCSGTSTDDAAALVSAGIIKLSDRKCNFIFATHLHFLSHSKRINKLENVKKLHMSVKYDSTLEKIIYERKLKDGSGPSTYGIEVCKGMNLEESYIDLAREIRMEITDNKDVNMLIGKKSNYNQSKFISYCEVCVDEVAIDTHHIKFQCTADSDKKIDGWHKDSKFNLVGLCKKCHMMVHSSPPKLKINGYIQSNNDIELDFNYL